MPPIVSALMFAVLVTTIPFAFVIAVLARLPRPLVPSHRRWPIPLNVALMAAITGAVTLYIWSAYYRHGDVSTGAAAAKLLLVALAYGFSLSLLMRQFCGVYSEYIVTVGLLGFGLRKIAYRHIQNVDKVSEQAGETRFHVTTTHGTVTLWIPTRYASILFDQIRAQQKAENLNGSHR